MPPFMCKEGTFLHLAAICFSSISALLILCLGICCLWQQNAARSSQAYLGLFTWYFGKIQSGRELTYSQVEEILIKRDQYGCSGSSLMRLDLKRLVKSQRVKGNKKDLSLVEFRAGPRRLQSLTWKDGGILTGS